MTTPSTSDAANAPVTLLSSPRTRTTTEVNRSGRFLELKVAPRTLSTLFDHDNNQVGRMDSILEQDEKNKELFEKKSNNCSFCSTKEEKREEEEEQEEEYDDNDGIDNKRERANRPKSFKRHEAVLVQRHNDSMKPTMTKDGELIMPVSKTRFTELSPRTVHHKERSA